MAIRFRKSLKLAPGVRMNLSGSGVSWTLGPRGASVGIGKRGTFLNTGIPGSGLYARERVGGSAKQPARAASGSTQVAITASVEEDGSLAYKDSSGAPLSDALVAEVKRQQPDQLRTLIEQACEEVNGIVEAVEGIHLGTPPPCTELVFTPAKFPRKRPAKPTPRPLGFLDRLFKRRRARVEQANAAAEADFEKASSHWQAERDEHNRAQAEVADLVGQANAGQLEALEAVFEGQLQSIVWPKETSVSFQLSDDVHSVALDIDLPEVEDMPSRTATVPQRAFKLSIKKMGQTQVQKLYMRHIHAVLFRFVGEAFAMLPTVTEVVASGYSQRPDRQTGEVVDEYLLSLRVCRADWEQVNFDNLGEIDPVHALERYELVRNMTKTGVFKRIEPLTLEAVSS